MIERIAITSREQWLEARRQDVTASAIAALLGVHPYQSAYGLWMLKNGEASEDPEETPPMKRGRRLEKVAVEILHEEHSEFIFDAYPHGFYYRDPAARLGATPDVTARDKQGRLGVIQIKSVEPRKFKEAWHNENGELVPPLYVAVQAIVEAHLTGAEWAAVAALVVSHGADLHVVPVPIHLGIIDRLKAEVAAFWRSIKSGQRPDPDHGRDGKLLEQMFVGNGEIVDLSEDNHLVELADERKRLSADAKAAECRLKRIKSELLAKIGNASAARIADGRLITAKRIERNGYAVPPSSYVDIRIKEVRHEHASH